LRFILAGDYICNELGNMYWYVTLQDIKKSRQLFVDPCGPTPMAVLCGV